MYFRNIIFFFTSFSYQLGNSALLWLETRLGRVPISHTSYTFLYRIPYSKHELIRFSRPVLILIILFRVRDHGHKTHRVLMIDFRCFLKFCYQHFQGCLISVTYFIRQTITVYSHTFTLFWLPKTSVIVGTFQWSFRVFICAFYTKNSSYYTYFVTFPFHVVSNRYY